MPMPCLDDFMWRKHASLLTITFKDKEIVAVSTFNNCLESLKSIYSKLVDLDTMDREFNSTYASSGAELSSLFHILIVLQRKLRAYWMNLKKLHWVCLKRVILLIKRKINVIY